MKWEVVFQTFFLEFRTVPTPVDDRSSFMSAVRTRCASIEVVLGELLRRPGSKNLSIEEPRLVEVAKLLQDTMMNFLIVRSKVDEVRACRSQGLDLVLPAYEVEGGPDVLQRHVHNVKLDARFGVYAPISLTHSINFENTLKQ